MKRPVVRCASAFLLLLLNGCALFTTVTDGGFKLPSPWASQSSEIAADAPVLSMAKLETIVVSQPANEVRIRRLAWQELDESGVMAPEKRRQLNDAGLRVGVAGGSIPWALQSLAREKESEQNGVSALPQLNERNSHTNAPVGPVFSVMEGGRTIIDLQSGIDGQLLPIDQISELKSLRSREKLRCVFEVTAKELKDGWVLLNFLPQIHSGAAGLRLSVQGSSDKLPVRQDVLPLYDLQFSIKLHRGDTAVVGHIDSADWNLGKLLFQPDVNSRQISEKLLMIRLLEIDQIRGSREAGLAADMRR
ncbi:MAG: hypothetical protein KDA85_00470 [Planctomycetaceae bacterium]|nr:hypothetical protein [Planctomycetaceae bacterium]